MKPQDHFQTLVDLLSVANVNDTSEVATDHLQVLNSAFQLMSANKGRDDLNMVSAVGQLTVAFFEFLNLNFLQLDNFVLNAHLVPAIVNEISDKQLRTIPAPTPVDGYDQWVAVAKQSLNIGLSRRISLTEQARLSLAICPADLPIHQRHRLELWACGLMPDDLVPLVDQQSLYQDRLLALPKFELRVNNEHQRQLLITQLPHLWRHDLISLSEAIRAQLQYAFTAYGNPTDTIITNAIFQAVAICLGEGTVTMESSNPEAVDPVRHFMEFFIFDHGEGMRVTCPRVAEAEAERQEQMTLLAEENAAQVESKSHIDPESLQPHGAGVAAAEERQAELLGDTVPPVLHVDHPSSGAGVAAAQERQAIAIQHHHDEQGD